MPLLTLTDVSRELSVPSDTLQELIEQHVLTPFGGRARLGEPRFAACMLPEIRDKLRHYLANC